MLQKSGEKITWDGAKTLVNNGTSTTNLNWLIRRISGCHQQFFWLPSAVFPIEHGEIFAMLVGSSCRTNQRFSLPKRCDVSQIPPDPQTAACFHCTDQRPWENGSRVRSSEKPQPPSGKGYQKNQFAPRILDPKKWIYLQQK